MDIVSEIRRDPEEGAKRLEREYKSRLMVVAMNLCGDKSEAETLVYDTMGKAVSQIESLSKPESLLSWMCSILVNTYSKSTRRMSSEKVVYTDNLPDQAEETDGAESVFKSVDGALLRDAIAELPEKLRESIILRYFMDMPLTQMARFLTIPVGTVNSRLHLARKALAARLNPTAKKACAVALVALALLGATAGAVAVLNGGKETKATEGTKATVSYVPEVPCAASAPEPPTSSTTKETQPMKTLAKSAAVVAAALVFPSAYGGVQATGGTEKYFFEGYMVHTFTNSGTFTVTHGGKVDVLVVAGGGGGGSSRYGGGGGGAGGVVFQENLSITAGVFTVTVGNGGTGGIGKNSDSSTNATKGEDSSIEGFDVAVAKGGGAGGSGNSNYGTTSGGSGGGRGGVYDNDGNGSAGTAGQGNAGGGSKNSASYNFTRGGGGGGAGSAGTKGIGGSSSGYTNGTGGIGIACSISGEEKWYGGGGGGGASNVAGLTVAGGKGGGGAGKSVKSASDTTPVNGVGGTPNTGGGGGGGGGFPGKKSADGGAGGSGIVIIRYAIDTEDHFDEITGGMKTRDGDYEIHTFTNSGTLHVAGSSRVDVLVVGGGGGGGAALSGGGGGGAGGVVYKQNLVLVSGDYDIVVGNGGTGGVVNDAGTAITTYSQAGSASSAFGFTAKGGGRGGNTNEGGGAGASGGGAAAYTSTTVFKRIGGGAHDAGQGNDGGASTNDFNQGLIGVAGGGGGAGENGHDGVITSREYSGRDNYGGAGGDGIACSITGEEKWYGGGGGGGFSTYVNANERGKVPGGKGGGGRGSGRYTTNPPVIHSGTDGENGTGGGGGGGGGYSPNMANGGRGGDGIVIIRCKRIPKGFILIVQ